jgi:hypothetical protein
MNGGENERCKSARRQGSDFTAACAPERQPDSGSVFGLVDSPGKDLGRFLFAIRKMPFALLGKNDPSLGDAQNKLTMIFRHSVVCETLALVSPPTVFFNNLHDNSHQEAIRR